MIGKSNIGGENLNAQLTAQETLIQTITESLVGKATLANATADKILEGFCAYVGQQLIQGTAKVGVSGIDFGEVTLAANGDITINHGLGVAPTAAYLVPTEIFQRDYTKKDLSTAKYGEIVEAIVLHGSINSYEFRQFSGYANTYSADAVTFTPYDADKGFHAGTYKWFTMA